MEYKRLYKSATDKAIFGVCGGIAEYFGIDSLIVRLVMVLFTLAFGAGILFYIIAALIMPKRPEAGGQPVYEQPAAPGAYNAGGTMYVNRASSYEDDYQPYRAVYQEPVAQEVTRSAVPQEVSAEETVPAEPADPVAAAWAKERRTQETRGAAAGAPKEEPKPEPPKQEAPKQESPKQEPPRQGLPKEETARPERPYQAYQTYQQPQSAPHTQQTQRAPRSSGDHTRSVLGLILILIGAFVLVRVFLPRFDIRILFAICVIVAGGLLIAKRE